MKHLTSKHDIDNPLSVIWQSQLTETNDKPWLASILLRFGHKILHRFSHFYRRLTAQPRRTRRFLQAKLAPTLVGASLLLALSSTPTYAATINVYGTTCTLTNAIIAANTDAPAGGCLAGSGADTIVLQAGSTHTLTSAYGYGGGLPAISTEITIEGNGATIERASGAPSFGILEVSNSGDLTLNSVTINNGYGFGVNNRGVTEINDSTISNAENGSGVENNGSLVINNSVVTGNGQHGIGTFSAFAQITGSTVSNNGNTGIYNYEGEFDLDNSIISGNADSGIRTIGNFLGAYAPITIANSTIINNETYGQGGGIYAQSGIISVTNSTISGNNANKGGGVFKSGSFGVGGEMTIDNSTISGNSANQGGGVFNDSKLTIINSTISNNNATLGGGIFGYIGNFDVNDSTITGNTADTGGGIYTYYEPVYLNRTMVSGNAATYGREVFFKESFGSPADNYNLFGYNGDAGVSGFTPGTTDIVPGAGVQVSDILDTTLQNNGGNTDTHALVSGSPAVDAVPAAACIAPTDQRSVARPQGPDCDIGAFELEQVVNQAPTADANGPYTVDEGSTTPLDGSGSSDPDAGDTLTYEWDFDYDGVTFDVDATGPAPTFDATTLDGPDARTVALRVTDNAGASDIDTGSLTVENVAPTIDAIATPVDPVDIDNQPVSVEVAFSDVGVPDTHDVTWDWGDGNSDTQTGAASPAVQNHTYAEPGVYTVTVTVTDDDNGIASQIYEFIVIYDPAGGFVTGGGWIYSEPGAYLPDPSLEGKANFGFVSKYKKGKSTPDGNTQFNFKTGDINFHSDSYDWLVINQGGTNAQYKGTGTINGALAPNGDFYKFKLWAKDGDPVYGDTFRIKIWYEDDGEIIVYDNGFDQSINGGNIKIHKAK